MTNVDLAKPTKPLGEDNQAHHKQRTHACCFQDIHEVRKAGVPPHAAVEIKKIENKNLGDQDDGKKPDYDRELALRNVKVEAQEIGKIPGDAKEG